MNKTFVINGKEIKVENYKLSGETLTFVLEGKTLSYQLSSRDGLSMVIDKGGKRFNASVGSANRDGESMVIANGKEGVLGEAGRKMKKAGAAAGGLTSPMPGKIFKILKEVGSEVKKGEAILILEAMKMEHSIRSDKDGNVKKIHFSVGQLVQGGVVLAEVESK